MCYCCNTVAYAITVRSIIYESHTRPEIAEITSQTISPVAHVCFVFLIFVGQRQKRWHKSNEINRYAVPKWCGTAVGQMGQDVFGIAVNWANIGLIENGIKTCPIEVRLE